MKGQADQDWLGELIPQLRLNCHRVDAQAAAHYSLCGLLLRLRNLYKWERKLPPWREEEPDKMLAWVTEREELWLKIDEQELQPLRLAGRVFDPLDSEGVNALIEPTGTVYGAGLAGGLVPAFFLGRVDRKKSHDGLIVYELGEEYVPDIFFLPGLRQNQNIFLRKVPLGFLLWDKIADPTASVRRFVDFGLKGYGLSRKDLISRPGWENFIPALEGELQAVLWHELGEAKGDAEAADLLAGILADHPISELEHFVRGVKDLLADTCEGGRLSHIIDHRAVGALGFYPAWTGGFLKLLFPEIGPAVERFMSRPDWGLIERAKEKGRQRARDALLRLREVLKVKDRRKVPALARSRVIEPLTAR